MENASERLTELLTYLKISANKLAIESLNYKDNVKIYHIKNGRNNFSSEIAKDISTVFPEINYNWLLTGEGSMLSTSAKEPSESSESIIDVVQLLDRENHYLKEQIKIKDDTIAHLLSMVSNTDNKKAM